MIKKTLRHFQNTEILFNFKILMVVASLVIFRFYNPRELGVFVLFISVVTVFSPVISEVYNLAIFSARKNQDGNDLFVL